MVAVVSGNGLGLLNGSLGVLGGQGSVGNSSQGRLGEAVFVNAATGNLIVSHLDDAIISGRGTNGLARTYNSQGLSDGDNNDGWRIGVYRSLGGLSGTVNTAGSYLQKTESDGSLTTFTYDTSLSLYVSKAGSGAYNTLSYNGTNWTYRDGDSQASETYDWISSAGKLLSEADLDGNTTTYGYSGSLIISITTQNIKGAITEAIALNYSGTLLSDITYNGADDAGVATSSRRVSYRYDTNNRLSQVMVDLSPDDLSTADGKVYTSNYSYDANGQLATLSQTDGTSLTFTYDANGRVATVKDALNRMTGYDYSVAGQLSITDALSQITVITYETAAGESNGYIKTIKNPANITLSYSYTANGDIASVNDGRNTLTCSYDSNGNLLQQWDAAGNTSSYTYDNANRKLTETHYTGTDADEAGLASHASGEFTTRYVYDDLGHLRFTVSAEGRVTESIYGNVAGRNGVMLSSISYTGAVYTGSYNPVTGTPSVENIIAWRDGDYYNGLPAITTNRDQHTDYSYDWRGQLSTSTTYQESPDGTLSSNVTRYIYDARGQLLKTIDAKTNPTSYAYDGLGRMIGSTNALAQSTSSSYDDTGKKVSVTYANGRKVVSTYDAAGQLTSVMESNNTLADLGTTRYYYDTLGRERLSVDATSVRHFTLYDNAGRKVGEIDNAGSLTEYRYTSNGLLAQRYQYANRVANSFLALGGTDSLLKTDGTPSALLLSNNTLTSILPTLDNETDIDPEQDRSTWTLYDQAGRIGKTINEQGFVTEFHYDGANRVVKTLQYSNAYSDLSSLTLNTTAEEISVAENGQDRITRAFYDNDGLKRGDLDAEGYLTEYQYDGMGRLVSQTRHADRQDIPEITDGAWLYTQGQLGDGYTKQLYITKAGELYVASTSQYETPELTYWGQLGDGDLSRYKITDMSWDRMPDVIYIAADGEVWKPADEAGASVLLGTIGTGDISRYRVVQTDTGFGVLYIADDGAISLADQNDFQYLDTVGTGDPTRYIEGAGLFTYIAPSGEVSIYGWNYLENRYSLSTGPTMGNGDPTRYRIYRGSQRDLGVFYTSPSGEVYFAGQSQLLSYDQSGNITGSSWAFDAPVLMNVMGDGTPERYNFYFEGAGNPPSVSYNDAPNWYANATPVKSYSSDKVALLFATSSPDDLHAYRYYDAAGRLGGEADAEGYLTTYTYDANGNRLSQSRYKNSVKNYSITPENLESLSVAAGGFIKTRYTYDALNRLSTEIAVDGTVTKYVYNTAGLLKSKTVAFGAVEADSAARMTSYTYDLQGQLLTTTPAEGGVITNVYDKANRLRYSDDALGNRTLYYYDTTFSADGSRYTYSVDAAGFVTRSGYNALGQLSSTRRSANSISNATNLATVRNGKGGVTTAALKTALQSAFDLSASSLDQRSSTTYTLNGLVQAVQDAFGNSTNYQYNSFGQVRQQVDALQGDTFFDYDRRGLLTRLDQEFENWYGDGGLYATTRTTYDAFGRATDVTDPNGNTRYTQYDGLGRVLDITDALGNIQSYTYDTLGRVLTQTDALNRKTITTYDDVHRKITVKTPEGVITETVLTRHGQTLSIKDGLGNTTTYSYDKNGNLKRTLFADGVSHTDSDYDLGNRLIATYDTSTDAGNGTQTTYIYDSINRLLTRTVDPTVVAGDSHLNLMTRYQYDGRSVTQTDANGVITKTEADAKGRTVKITSAFGATDTTVTSVTQISYDALDRKVQIIEGAGSSESRTTVYDYDALGRRTAETIKGVLNEAGTAAVDLTTHYNYDNNGNLIHKTDANGHEASYAYDQNNRLVYTVDSQGAVTQSTYDKNGRVTKVRRYANAITLPLEGFGGDAHYFDGLLQPSSLDHIDLTAYDKDGRAAATLDSKRQLTRTKYDAAGRVVSTTRYATALAAGVAFNAATMASNSAADQTRRVVYNALGQVSYSIDPENFVTQQVFNASGQVISEIRYAVPYTGSGNPSLTDMDTFAAGASASARVSHMAYDAAGRLQFSVDAGNYVTETRYVGGRNLVESTTRYAANTQASDYSAAAIALDMAGRVDSTNDQTTRFQYDAAGRLVSKMDALNGSEIYTYTQLGLKKTYQNALGNTWTYDYDAAGRLIKETTPTVVVSWYNPAGTLTHTSTQLVTSYRYDGVGNLRWRDEGVSGSSTLSVDDNNAFISSQARSTEYRYDGMNRQTQVVAPTAFVEGGNLSITNARFQRGTLDRSDNSSTGVNWDSTPELITTVTYDVFGRAVMQQDAGGNYSYKVYDTLDRVKYEIDALRQVTEYSYDAFGNTLSLTRYGSAISLVKGVPPSATSVSNKLALITDKRVINTEYDHNNRVITVREGTGNAYSVDGDANAGTLTGAWGGMDESSPDTFDIPWSKKTTTHYNAFGEADQQATVLVGGTREAATYNYLDVRGRKLAQVDAEGYLTRYSYDAFGNLLSTTEYAQSLGDNWELKADGTPVDPASADETSGRDRITISTYDQLNRKRTDTRVNVSYDENVGLRGVKTLTGSLTTTYGYDAVGNQTSVEDAQHNVTQTYYDALGHQRAVLSAERSDDSVALQLPAVDVWHMQAKATTVSGISKGTIYDNKVVLDWAATPLQGWGDGEVKVTLTFTRKTSHISGFGPGSAPIYAEVQESTPSTYSQAFNAQSIKNGATLAWNNSADGIVALTQISLSVYADGAYHEIYNAAPNTYKKTLRFEKPAANNGSIAFSLDGNTLTDTPVDSKPFRYFMADVSTLSGDHAVGMVWSQDSSPLLSSAPGNNLNFTNVSNKITPTTNQVVAGKSRALTTMDVDTYGNVIQTRAYANNAGGYANVLASFTAQGTGLAGLADAARDRITTSHYDLSGHLLTQKDAEGNVTQKAYDWAGHVTREWVANRTAENKINNLVRAYKYDAVGRQIATYTRDTAPAQASLLGSPQVVNASMTYQAAINKVNMGTYNGVTDYYQQATAVLSFGNSNLSVWGFDSVKATVYFTLNGVTTSTTVEIDPMLDDAGKTINLGEPVFNGSSYLNINRVVLVGNSESGEQTLWDYSGISSTSAIPENIPPNTTDPVVYTAAVTSAIDHYDNYGQAFYTYQASATLRFNDWDTSGFTTLKATVHYTLNGAAGSTIVDIDPLNSAAGKTINLGGTVYNELPDLVITQVVVVGSGSPIPQTVYGVVDTILPPTTPKVLYTHEVTQTPIGSNATISQASTTLQFKDWDTSGFTTLNATVYYTLNGVADSITVAIDPLDSAAGKTINLGGGFYGTPPTLIISHVEIVGSGGTGTQTVSGISDTGQNNITDPVVYTAAVIKTAIGANAYSSQASITLHFNQWDTTGFTTLNAMVNYTLNGVAGSTTVEINPLATSLGKTIDLGGASVGAPLNLVITQVVLVGTNNSGTQTVDGVADAEPVGQPNTTDPVVYSADITPSVNHTDSSGTVYDYQASTWLHFNNWDTSGFTTLSATVYYRLNGVAGSTTVDIDPLNTAAGKTILLGGTYYNVAPSLVITQVVVESTTDSVTETQYGVLDTGTHVVQTGSSESASGEAIASGTTTWLTWRKPAVDGLVDPITLINETTRTTQTFGEMFRVDITDLMYPGEALLNFTTTYAIGSSKAFAAGTINTSNNVITYTENKNGLTLVNNNRVVQARSIYNAYGEITHNALLEVSGGSDAYAKAQAYKIARYDELGRAWSVRDNGVQTVNYYNSLGLVLVSMVSPNHDLSLLPDSNDQSYQEQINTLTDSAEVLTPSTVNADYQRTTSWSDRLGRIIRQQTPSYSSRTAEGISTQPTLTGAGVSGTATPAADGMALGLNWDSLAEWGGSEIRLEVDYKAAYYGGYLGHHETIAGIDPAAVSHSLTTALGYTPAASLNNNAVTRVQVWVNIKDSNNNDHWVLARDSDHKTDNTVLSWARDPITATGRAVLRYRSSTALASDPWQNLTVDTRPDGKLFVADITQRSTLSAGTYHYQLFYFDPSVDVPTDPNSLNLAVRAYASADGVFGVGASPSVSQNPAAAVPAVTITPVFSQGYDRWGNVIRTTDALSHQNQNAQTENRYNSNNQLTATIAKNISITTASGVDVNTDIRTETYYDSLGRQIGTRDAESVRQDRRVILSQIPTITGYTISSSSTSTVDGITTTITPINGGYLTTVSVAALQTSLNYNELGQLLSQRDAAQGLTQYRYDTFGNRTQQIQGYGEAKDIRTTRYDYDRLGQLLKTLKPLTTESYRYDALGNRIETTQWMNEAATPGTAAIVTRQAYDAFGRVIRTGVYDYLAYNPTDISSGLRDFAPLTALIKAATGDASAANPGLNTYVNGSGLESSSAYDAFGNKVRETNTAGDTLTWTYAGKRVLTHTDLAGVTTTYGYNSAGGLVSQTNNRTSQGSTAALNRDGILIDQNLQYRYDEAGHLQQIIDLSSGANNATQRFRTDALGRQVQDSFVDRTGISYRSTREYDALGRLSRVTSDNGSSVNYRYDANGNRRRTQVRWREGTEDALISYNSSGQVITQNLSMDVFKSKDYWYDYGSTDQMTVSQGVLKEGKIQASSQSSTQVSHYHGTGSGMALYTYAEMIDPDKQGIELSYNALGERLQVMSVQSNGKAQYERYSFDENSRLKEIQRWDDDDTNRENNDYTTHVRMLSSRSYDGANRITTQKNWDLANPTVNPKEQRDNTYDGAGHLVLQTTSRFDSNNSNPIASGAIGYQLDAAGTVLTQTTFHQAGGNDNTTYTITNRYDYLRTDSFKEQHSVGTSNLPDYQPGATDQRYDANGNLSQIRFSGDSNRNRNFITDLTGQIIAKDNAQTDSHLKTQRYLSADNGQRLSYGALETLDADQNYTPISDPSIGNSPSRYVVNDGDTLNSIALAIWGDASLWYILAEANGLSADSNLKIGQNLNIPTRVNQNHNSSSTIKPYNASAIIGDTTPSLTAPPPPKQCGMLGQLIATIVTVIASYYGGPLGAMAANVVIQRVKIGMGYQEKFSWGEVAVTYVAAYVGNGFSNVAPAVTQAASSAVGSQLVTEGSKELAIEGGKQLATGVAGKLGMNAGIEAMMVNSVSQNLVTQGLNMAAGLQKRFDWRSVAASIITAPLTQALSGSIMDSDFAKAGGWQTYTSSFASQVITQGITQGTQILLGSGGKMDWRSIATNAFGQVLGNAIVAEARIGNMPQGMSEAQANAYKYQIRLGESDARALQAANMGRELQSSLRNDLPNYQATQAEADEFLNESVRDLYGNDGVAGYRTVLENGAGLYEAEQVAVHRQIGGDPSQSLPSYTLTSLVEPSFNYKPEGSSSNDEGRYNLTQGRWDDYNDIPNDVAFVQLGGTFLHADPQYWPESIRNSPEKMELFAPWWAQQVDRGEISVKTDPHPIKTAMGTFKKWATDSIVGFVGDRAEAIFTPRSIVIPPGYDDDGVNAAYAWQSRVGNSAQSVAHGGALFASATEEIGAVVNPAMRAYSAGESFKEWLAQVRKDGVTPSSMLSLGVALATGRLPRNFGYWKGEAGNGLWHSLNKDVNAITKGRPIPFINGRPDFSKWSKGELTFEEGLLKGTKKDFNLVYEYIAKAKGLKSNYAAEQYLKLNQLTPHHLSGTTIQLIPTALHGNIPHIGSASDLRKIWK